MYFPYLRGKQFELLALREIAPRLGAARCVTPIIEPVREPGDSGLYRCLTALEGYAVGFVLIANPTVGALRTTTGGPRLSPALVDFILNRDAGQSWNIGLIVEEGTDVTALAMSYAESLGNTRPLTLIHKALAVSGQNVPIVDAPFRRGFDVINSESIRAERHARGPWRRERGVTLSDGFDQLSRNSDYISREETTFNEDLLYYEGEGWFGFGDYLTIGAGYTEGGFSPRAVAIHWTYQAALGQAIMIRSFTSESNGDIGNVGGKFLEAAGKLVNFLNAHDIHTDAAEIMRNHVLHQTYPGLGVVKKLSILNHLQLMTTILGQA
jgi:hypothetical protein